MLNLMAFMLTLVQVREADRIAPIPEPGTIGLMVVAGVGLMVVGLMRRGKR